MDNKNAPTSDASEEKHQQPTLNSRRMPRNANVRIVQKWLLRWKRMSNRTVFWMNNRMILAEGFIHKMFETMVILQMRLMTL